VAKPLPGIDVPLVNPQTGQINQAWYEYFQGHQRLTQLPDVSPIAPTDTQVLKYVAATKLWTPS
jgi:hypothetical protein